MVECPAKREGRKVWTVYILLNIGTGQFYIGYTGDIARRETEHNRKQTKSTMSDYDWVIIYLESYTERVEAIKRERTLKSFKGGNELWKLLMRW